MPLTPRSTLWLSHTIRSVATGNFWYLVDVWAQPTTEDYIRAENKLQFNSKLFIKRSWCFEPSQQQRITSGLNTNFTLSPSHSFHKSSYHKPCCCCFFSLFIFHGHSTREPASSSMTYFILRAYTGTGVSHSQHRGKKIGRGFGKYAGEWTERVEISKEEIPCSKCSMYDYILTYSKL